MLYAIAHTVTKMVLFSVANSCSSKEMQQGTQLISEIINCCLRDAWIDARNDAAHRNESTLRWVCCVTWWVCCFETAWQQGCFLKFTIMSLLKSSATVRKLLEVVERFLNFTNSSERTEQFYSSCSRKEMTRERRLWSSIVVAGFTSNPFLPVGHRELPMGFLCHSVPLLVRSTSPPLLYLTQFNPHLS